MRRHPPPPPPTLSLPAPPADGLPLAGHLRAELAQVRKEKQACETRLQEAFDDLSRKESLEKRCKLLSSQLKEEKERCKALAAEVSRMVREGSVASPEKQWDFDACSPRDASLSPDPFSPFLGMSSKSGALPSSSGRPRPPMQMSSRHQGGGSGLHALPEQHLMEWGVSVASSSSQPDAHALEGVHGGQSSCGTSVSSTSSTTHIPAWSRGAAPAGAEGAAERRADSHWRCGIMHRLMRVWREVVEEDPLSPPQAPAGLAGRPYLQISGLAASDASVFSAFPEDSVAPRDSSPQPSLFSSLASQSMQQQSLFSSYIAHADTTAALAGRAGDVRPSLSPPSAAAMMYVAGYRATPTEAQTGYASSSSAGEPRGEARRAGGDNSLCPTVSTQDTTLAPSRLDNTTLCLSDNGSPAQRTPEALSLTDPQSAGLRARETSEPSSAGLVVRGRGEREGSPLEDLESLLRRAELADARAASRRREAQERAALRTSSSDRGALRTSQSGGEMCTAAKGTKTPRGGPDQRSPSAGLEMVTPVSSMTPPGCIEMPTPETPVSLAEAPRAGTVTPRPCTPRITGDNALLLHTAPREGAQRDCCASSTTALPKSPRTLTVFGTPDGSNSIYWSDPIVGGDAATPRGGRSGSKVPTVLPTVKIAVRGTASPPPRA